MSSPEAFRQDHYRQGYQPGEGHHPARPGQHPAQYGAGGSRSLPGQQPHHHGWQERRDGGGSAQGPGRPERFQAFAAQERVPAWRSLASGAVLVAVVAGLPVLLLATVGLPPVPRDLDVAVLLRAVDAQVLLGLLVWVVWLAWAQFTVCTVVEVVSALQGRGVPGHVPLSGGVQVVVRRLVVSTLLLGSLSSVVVPAVVAAPGAGGQEVAVSQAGGPGGSGAITGGGASVSTGGTQGAADPGAPAASQVGAATDGQGAQDAQVGAQEGVRYMLGDVELDAQTGAELVGQRVYIVQPPQGRYHDNLWDIAERTLGEGRAYTEIYDLNAGRPQPDGRSLELARLIHPGWVLVMPESAQSVDRVVAVPVEEPAPAAAPAPGGQEAPAGEQQEDSSPTQEGQDDVEPAQMPAVGGLLAAALVGLLVRRRRWLVSAQVGEETAELERLLRVGADHQRSTRLDAVLRGLEALSPRPRPYAVAISDKACYLRLALPLPQAPAPWQVQDGGLTWALPVGQEPATGPAGAGGHVMPGLVTIGRDEQGADILVDLAAADGEISVSGEPTMAAEVVGALALELCTNPWSRGAVVAAAGLPAAVGEMLADRLVSPEQLARSLRPGEAAGAAGGPPGAALDGPGGEDAVGGTAGEVAGWAGGGDVLAGPRPEAVDTFVLVAGGEVLPPLPPGRRVALVRAGSGAAGRAGDAADGGAGDGAAAAGRGVRWRIEVDASGSARIDPLGLVVTASRATEQEVAALAGLLAPAPVGGPRPPVPDPPVPPVTTAALRAASVRIHVLGATVVETASSVEEARRGLLTEAAVCVALHPEGILPHVLGAMLWPLGVTGDVVASTVERLRAWLGADSQGVPHLRQDAQGRLVAGPGVVVDWDVLRCLLAASRTSPPAQEARLLAEALRLVRGPVGADVPAGRYAWLARVRTARQVEELVVDAAHRLAELTGGTDPDGAAAAVETGLGVVDLNQVLWRDRLRLAARRGPGWLERDVRVLLDRAGAADLEEVDPATAALVADLDPYLAARLAQGPGLGSRAVRPPA